MAEPATPTPPTNAPPIPTGHELALAWARAHPIPAALAGTLALTITLFYVAVPLFFVPYPARHLTALQWIRSAWNPENHYDYGPFVPVIILFLVWNALPKLRGVAPVPSAWGMALLVLGVLLFLVGARTLEPRIAWAALPCLLSGTVLYAWGLRAARVLLFPVLCIFFMIPVPGIDQTTVQLQVLATKSASLVCNFIGIKMQAVGTSLHALDESFQFQVVGDCSGINSLMAISLMTAVFAHLTQDRLWKKIVLFAASVPVALIGNMARLTAIILVAKSLGQQIAGGWFHEVSTYLVSLPFAFGSLCVVNMLLNWRTPFLPGGPRPPLDARPPSGGLRGPVPGESVGYDY